MRGESEEREIKRGMMRKKTIMRKIRVETVTKSKKERLHNVWRGIRNWRRRWEERERL